MSLMIDAKIATFSRKGSLSSYASLMTVAGSVKASILAATSSLDSSKKETTFSIFETSAGVLVADGKGLAGESASCSSPWRMHAQLRRNTAGS